MIVLGSIEAANMMFLKQTLIQGAYEGAKVAILSEGTNSDAESAIREVTDGRNLGNLEIDFDPPNVETAVPGQFTVTLDVAGETQTQMLNVLPDPLFSVFARTMGSNDPNWQLVATGG